MFEHVTTRYQTLHTWISHNSTRYHNFTALPHALLHALQYIFSQFSMAWSYVQHVTTYIIIYLFFFFKIDSNAWKRVANSLKPGKSQRKYTAVCVLTHVVTISSYGNTFSSGQSMFPEFENLTYPSVISISVRLNVRPHKTKLYIHG